MGWREYLETLERDELHEALEAILELHIDHYGCDGEVGYHDAEDDRPAELYWRSSGDPLIERES